MAVKIDVVAIEASSQKISSGNIAKAMMAASDEILKTLANKSHIAMMIKPINQLNATLTAIAVATPLPPLKRKNIG